MRGANSIGLMVLLGLLFTAAVEGQLRTRVVVSGLDSPVAFVQDPADRTTQFVVEQAGRIRVVRNGALLPADFLDITSEVAFGGEQGLLGMAFAPDAATSGRFFVNFSRRQGGHTIVARFRRSTDAARADGSSRFDLQFFPGVSFIPQPFTNHNGGHLAFGPDGHLYIGLGDGGSGNDPDHRAQNGSELLGKMLRIDVSVPDADPSGYRIPPDNPFLGGGARPEVWAFGLRNPWRYSFDDPSRGGTGALLIGDVGQGAWEEVDYEPRGRSGRNYGWRNREGAHNNVTSRPPAFTPLVDPVHEYDHREGQSITGGYVYRGTALGTSFQGRYFFADFVSSRLWSIGLAIDAGSGEARLVDLREHTDALAALGGTGGISSFGVDASGELYVVTYRPGRVVKIIGQPKAPDAPAGFRIIR